MMMNKWARQLRRPSFSAALSRPDRPAGPATQGHPPVAGSCLEGSGEVFHPHLAPQREIIYLFDPT